jgi:hypothetical protein
MSGLFQTDFFLFISGADNRDLSESTKRANIYFSFSYLHGFLLLELDFGSVQGKTQMTTFQPARTTIFPSEAGAKIFLSDC